MIRGFNANKIIFNAERKLLNERVRQINYKLDGLNARKSNPEKLLREKLSDEIFAETKEFITRGQLAQHEKGKDRQKTKFERIQQKKTTSEADSDPNWRSNSSEPKTTTQAKTDKRWVKNLSSHTLTEPEKSLLSKGLNFAVAPNKIPSIDIVTETESAIHRARLPQRQAEALRTKVATTLKVSKPPASNITREERAALKDLATNQGILILLADKGRCTVVLDSEQYDRKNSPDFVNKIKDIRVEDDETISVRNKTAELATVLDTYKPDIVAGTESWLNQDIASSEIFPSNYIAHRKDKLAKEGNSLDELDMSIGKMGSKINSDNVIILDDFNTPGIKWDTTVADNSQAYTGQAEKLLHLMDNHGLFQTVEEPTRNGNLLDLVLVNNPNIIEKTTVVPGISDHDMVLVDVNLAPKQNRKPKRKVYIRTKADEPAIKKDLTESLRRHCRKKQRLYNKAKKRGQEEDWNKYKRVKRGVQKSIRQAHSKYVADILGEAIVDKPKTFWSYIKGLRKDIVGVAPLKVGNTIISDSGKKAEALSSQLKSVFTEEDTTDIPSLDQPCTPPMEHIEVSTDGVEKNASRSQSV
ncbi:hypothetical protein Bbelb_361640 [Branchiostoma belcheri]|nr:hypothetical protein Bbelb_361640 [Branchiostoma belcheri]